MASVSTLFTFLLINIALLGLPTVFADNVLYTGETLSQGQPLDYESYRLIMQGDCNLVLYDDGRAIWATDTANSGSRCYVKMQNDGNLVVYNGSNWAVWASNTNKGNGNYALILQRDRNLVIYGGALWATGTNIAGTADVVISGKLG